MDPSPRVAVPRAWHSTTLWHGLWRVAAAGLSSLPSGCQRPPSPKAPVQDSTGRCDDPAGLSPRVIWPCRSLHPRVPESANPASFSRWRILPGGQDAHRGTDTACRQGRLEPPSRGDPVSTFLFVTCDVRDQGQARRGSSLPGHTGKHHQATYLPPASSSRTASSPPKQLRSPAPRSPCPGCLRPPRGLGCWPPSPQGPRPGPGRASAGPRGRGGASRVAVGRRGAARGAGCAAWRPGRRPRSRGARLWPQPGSLVSGGRRTGPAGSGAARRPRWPPCGGSTGSPRAAPAPGGSSGRGCPPGPWAPPPTAGTLSALLMVRCYRKQETKIKTNWKGECSTPNIHPGNQTTVLPAHTRVCAHAVPAPPAPRRAGLLAGCRHHACSQSRTGAARGRSRPERSSAAGQPGAETLLNSAEGREGTSQRNVSTEREGSKPAAGRVVARNPRCSVMGFAAGTFKGTLSVFF